MRTKILAAVVMVAMLFTTSAVAVDLSRMLPTFELPAAPRLRAESPTPQGPPATTPPHAPAVASDDPAGTEQASAAKDEVRGAPAADATTSTQSQPTRRERGWREMLPGLLHQP